MLSGRDFAKPGWPEKGRHLPFQTPLSEMLRRSFPKLDEGGDRLQGMRVFGGTKRGL